MTTNQWPDDATLDALFAAARDTRSQALRFDPEAPVGFRVLTADEDAELVRAIAMPEQRHEEDREHLIRERDDAERVGDRDGAETATAHLEALDAEHQRDLPWRRADATPWSVMVSEFMLQQTPVSRVLGPHEAWLARWPTPADLAATPTGEAVRMWGRLGYPRRALRLHAAAGTRP